MTSDGCTCFFDGNWRPCCIGHDYEYADGGTLKDKIISDWKLAKCVARRGGAANKVAAALMFVGVSIGGYSRYRFR